MMNISKNKCVGCGICTTICPEGIKLENGIAKVKNENAECMKTIINVCPQNAIKNITETFTIAIGTDDNQTIKADDHVGMSKNFQIWEYSNGELVFKEKRENPKYKEDETRIHGDPGKAKATASALKDVDILIGKLIGPNIVRLKNQFVCGIIREQNIEKALEIIKENINEIIEEKNKIKRRGIILT